MPRRGSVGHNATPAPQPWLNRNQLTDLLAAAEDEGGHAYALACLLALNGLRVSEATGGDGGCNRTLARRCDDSPAPPGSRNG